MKILMIGAGGLGAYFGMRWLKAGVDVSFLVREKRKAQLDQFGLIVQTPTETLTEKVRALTEDELVESYDVVILSPKAYDLESAAQTVEKVKGNPMIVPLLNGLDHIDYLDQRFGSDRVLGGIVHIAATLTADGVVKQLSPMHKLTLGARTDAQAQVVNYFMQVSQKCPYDFVVADNIIQSLWDKWVFLATLAATTTLMKASVGQIVATRFGSDMIQACYASCSKVATLSGYPIIEPVKAQAMKLLLEPGSAFTASMLRDSQAGLKTEHEHILGAMTARAKQLDVDVPLIEAAYIALAIKAN